MDKNPDDLLHYDWKSICRKVCIGALKRGKTGRVLNAIITKKDSNARLPTDNSDEFRSEKEQLMADILEAMPDTIIDKLEDKLPQFIADADVINLWKTLEEVYFLDRREAYERYHRCTKRNALQLMISTLTGEYIEHALVSVSSSETLSSDVVNLNGSVALVSALVLTIVLPMFVTAAQTTDGDLDKAYCFCCAMSTIFESIAVLLTVRNIIAMSLLNEEDIKIYVQKATWVMIFPMKLHIYATILLLAALVVYSFNTIQFNYVIGFICIFLFPSVVLYIVSSTYSAKYVLDLKDEDAVVKLPKNSKVDAVQIFPTKE